MPPDPPARLGNNIRHITAPLLETFLGETLQCKKSTIGSVKEQITFVQDIPTKLILGVLTFLTVVLLTETLLGTGLLPCAAEAMLLTMLPDFK